jgi:hypothetical protein
VPVSSDDILKGVFGLLLGAIASVLGWLASVVMKNKDASLIGTASMSALGSRVDNLERTALTREDVRVVMETALDKRDRDLADRRVEWDKRLTLEIKAAVSEGIKQCPYMATHQKGQ